MTLLTHFGLAHPGSVPATLSLFPSGFEFTCGLEKIKVKGALIGRIASPGLNTSAELLRLVFSQSKGIQELRSFLMGNELLANQFEEWSINNSAFEQVGQEGEIHLLALAGQGTFLLVSP